MNWILFNLYNPIKNIRDILLHSIRTNGIATEAECDGDAREDPRDELGRIGSRIRSLFTQNRNASLKLSESGA
ncbi:hypothetical protein [Cohnella rhizosphaerae]|uniref:Uncharacterized protein n=1 Tax=Cohnella rhizosphaerae TaxID=1457232 RepID=A0A9X4QUL2_9BACL|nr:hypothetical protein [Cohnella rhizosphaerae]MDG0810597.1 hypothetical protein [Cohnella rhizosphaerae]